MVGNALNSNATLSAKLQDLVQQKRPDFGALRIQITPDVVLDVTATKGVVANIVNKLDILQSPFLDTQRPAYYLLNKLSPNQPSSSAGDFIVVAFIPETVASAKERMMYASSLSILRNALGGRIAKEYQVYSEAELDEARQGKELERHECMNQAEIEREEVLLSQERTRSEQIKELESRFGRLGRPFALLRRSVNLKEVDLSSHTENKVTVAAKSGGFQPVQLQLTDAAKQSVSGLLQSQDCNKMVELCIASDQKSIDLKSTKSIVACDRSEGSLERLLPVCEDEPRFYVLRLLPPEGGHYLRVFIYSCPDKSAPRLRMLYSTAREHTMISVSRLLNNSQSPLSPIVARFGFGVRDLTGLELELQVFDPSDLTFQFILDTYTKSKATSSPDKTAAPGSGFVPLKVVTRLKRLSRSKTSVRRTTPVRDSPEETLPQVGAASKGIAMFQQKPRISFGSQKKATKHLDDMMSVVRDAEKLTPTTPVASPDLKEKREEEEEDGAKQEVVVDASQVQKGEEEVSLVEEESTVHPAVAMESETVMSEREAEALPVVEEEAEEELGEEQQLPREVCETASVESEQTLVSAVASTHSVSSTEGEIVADEEEGDELGDQHDESAYQSAREDIESLDSVTDDDEGVPEISFMSSAPSLPDMIEDTFVSAESSVLPLMEVEGGLARDEESTNTQEATTTDFQLPPTPMSLTSPLRLQQQMDEQEEQEENRLHQNE